MLTIAGVTKKYGRDTYGVRDLSAACGRGLYGLIGPNGAGKTTLLRLMAGLIPPSAGRILLDGEEIGRHSLLLKARLGYLPQDFRVYPEMNGFIFLRYLAGLKGIPSRFVPGRIEAVAAMTGIAGQLHRPLRHWSGGMKKRLGMAQALLNDPDLLLLDEPAAGLDPEEKVVFADLMVRLSAARSVILSSHLVSDLGSYADRILLLAKGELLYAGPQPAMLAAATGHVWQATMPRDDWFAARTGLTAIAIRDAGETCQIRLLSEEKPNLSGVEPAAPNLEDAYLWFLKSSTLIKE